VFGQRDRPGSLTRLVCLDRQSGREEWILSPEDLEAGAAVKSLEFSGAPIAAGENVYVLGRGDTGTFESCYAICLDARTGEKKWVRYVAGSATGGAGFGGMESPLSPATSHPALSLGRLFIAGENGAVAALDAGTGAVRWLSLYPRRTAERGSREGAVEGQLLRPWSANPVIVKNGTVFILPSDGEDLLVYDAGDGRELKRIPRSAFGEADTLVGVWGEWVIVTGRRRAWGVKWAAYDAQAKDVSRVIVRSADLSEVRGRGMVTRDSVYVPTQRQLKRIALTGDLGERGLMVVESYPPYDQVWKEGEGPGNVVAAEGHLIVAGVDAVSVYADWGRVSSRLRQAVEASPEDLDLRLRYAQALVAGGKAKEGLEQMDEVIARLGGAAALEAGTHREAVFAAAMAMAHRATSAKDPATAEALFQRASIAADTPGEQVEYLLARADGAHGRKEWGQELQLLQGILSDPDLRSVGVYGGRRREKRRRAWRGTWRGDGLRGSCGRPRERRRMRRLRRRPGRRSTWGGRDRTRRCWRGWPRSIPMRRWRGRR
jgi:hypothetical protein